MNSTQKTCKNADLWETEAKISLSGKGSEKFAPQIGRAQLRWEESDLISYQVSGQPQHVEPAHVLIAPGGPQRLAVTNTAVDDFRFSSTNIAGYAEVYCASRKSRSV